MKQPLAKLLSNHYNIISDWLIFKRPDIKNKLLPNGLCMPIYYEPIYDSIESENNDSVKNNP